MPPSAFNKMEGNPDTHWDALLEARAMYINGGSSIDQSSGGMGHAALIGGGLLLALILIAMAVAVG